VNHFNGVQIIESEHALERVGPYREHHKNKSMSESYHKRIQKKWIKRWGYKFKPCMLQTQHGFIAHPLIYSQLVNEMRKQGGS